MAHSWPVNLSLHRSDRFKKHCTETRFKTDHLRNIVVPALFLDYPNVDRLIKHQKVRKQIKEFFDNNLDAKRTQ